MKPVTLWYVEVNNKFVYNHLEGGHSQHDKPLPFKDDYTNQHAWRKLEWKREYAYLEDGKVIHNEV